VGLEYGPRMSAGDRESSGRRASARRRIVLFVVGVLLPVGLFLLLAKGVAGGAVRGVDEGTLRALEQVQNGALTVVMRVITFLGGDWGVALPTAAVIVVVLVVCRRRLREALFVLVVMTGTGVLQLVTKLAFERPRPAVFEPLVAVSSSSYPSGHAMASAGLALVVAVIAWPARRRMAAIAGGAAFALLVGASRMYLGVHYPSDIAAGWLLAVAWVTAVWLAFDLAGRPVGLCAASGEPGGERPPAGERQPARKR